MTRLPRCLILLLTAAGLVQGCEGTPPRQTGGPSGEALFQLYCSGCHPNGGNAIYPQKSLDRVTLAANGITRPEGIVAVMRNPGTGMKKFDRNTIPDRDALAIATYVFDAFR